MVTDSRCHPKLVSQAKSPLVPTWWQQFLADIDGPYQQCVPETLGRSKTWEAPLASWLSRDNFEGC